MLLHIKMTSIAAGVPRVRYQTDEERHKGHIEACKRWYNKKYKPEPKEHDYGPAYSKEYHQNYYQANKEKIKAYQLNYREKHKVKVFPETNPA